MKEELSRAELLRRGLIGLTTLAVGAACGPIPKEEPIVEAEETFPVGFREVESLSPGFHFCRGLMVDGDDVWVAGDMAIGLVRPGSLDETKVPGAAQALVVRGETRLVALEDRIFDAGKAYRSWDSLGPRARLVEMVLVGNDVFVADAGNRCIHRFGVDGTPKGRFGEFIVPSPYLGLTILGNEKLAVANPGRHRVDLHDLEGTSLGSLGKPGQEMAAFCGCCNPMALAALPNGNLVTAEKGIPRVKIVRPDEALVTVVAPPKTFHPKTVGLEVAIQGEKILVLDPWEGIVRTFVPA